MLNSSIETLEILKKEAERLRNGNTLIITSGDACDLINRKLDGVMWQKTKSSPLKPAINNYFYSSKLGVTLCVSDFDKIYFTTKTSTVSDDVKYMLQDFTVFDMEDLDKAANSIYFDEV